MAQEVSGRLNTPPSTHVPPPDYFVCVFAEELNINVRGSVIAAIF